MASIKETKWDGTDVIEMEAGGYKATIIPSIGGNVIKLEQVDQNVNILRKVDSIEEYKSAPGVYGTPLLFPPNRIDGGKFTVCGKEYQFPINEPDRNNSLHGFLHDKEFAIKSTDIKDGQAIVELEFEADENTSFYKYFPHKFTCTLINILSEEGLKQVLRIKNQGDDSMPVGVGFHTAIDLNFAENTSADNVKVRMSVGKKIELDDRALPTEKIFFLDKEEEILRTEGQNPLFKDLDDHFTVEQIEYDGQLFHGAVIENEKNKIVYEIGPKYKYWMLWNCGRAGDFICPEPQTWLVNAPNINMSDEQKGLYILEPNQVFEEYTKLYSL